MKRTILFIALSAFMALTAEAQYQTRIIYIPGPGERQFGFSLAPTFSAQSFGVGASTQDAQGYEVSYPVDGAVTNNIGFSAGLFYGYETDHGGLLEWGNISTLTFGVNPFSGTVTVDRNGVKETHDIDYLGKRVSLRINPFLSRKIGDELSLSAGVGITIAPQLNGKLLFDGVAVDQSSKSEESLFLSLFNVNFDVNVGAKYWFTEQWYAGLQVQYTFYNLNPLKLFDDDGDMDWDNFPNGKVSIKYDGDVPAVSCLYLYPKSTLQAVFSIGYTW